MGLRYRVRGAEEIHDPILLIFETGFRRCIKGYRQRIQPRHNIVRLTSSTTRILGDCVKNYYNNILYVSMIFFYILRIILIDIQHIVCKQT